MRFFTRFIYTIPFFVCLNASAQVSLHDDPSNPAPDPSAMLDVIANDKGMLVPRVSLTGPSDAVTVPTPAASLLVFNEASLGGLTPGYFYNSGTSGSPAWTRLMSGNTTPLTGTGATSKVAFWTSATDLGNNTNFHWDNSGNGKLGIGTAAPTADYLLTLNASGSTQRGGLRIPMAGSSSSIPAIYITAGNNSARGFLFENSTASNAVIWGTGSVLTSTNIVSGYTAYRNSTGLSYGIYGI